MRPLDEFLSVGLALELANLRFLLSTEVQSSPHQATNIAQVIKAIERIEREAQAQFDALVGRPPLDQDQPQSLEDVLQAFRRADLLTAG